MRVRVGEMLAGVPVRDLQRMSPRVLAGVLPRLYPQMLERAYRHQDAGEPVYIVTAASQEMADLLAYVLAFDGGVGSRLEVVEGRYTGRAAGPFNYREGKVDSLRELAAREHIDLAASHAYSDSESDLPMLRAVGHPVVVNPDHRPRPHRRPRGLGDPAPRPPRAAPEGARRAQRRRHARRSRHRRARTSRRARAGGVVKS